MSPSRRHPLSFRFRSAAILDALRRKRQRRRRQRRRLRKLHATENISQGAISQVVDNEIQQPALEKLPEDILHHIHSLLPVEDAACVACVSRAFLRSWKCYSKLVLDDQELRLSHKESEKGKIYLIDKVDKILKNHYDNGVKVEALKLILTTYSNIKASYLDTWLRRTVKSGLKELHLEMHFDMKNNYNFPCLVLSDEGAASSIQYLSLLANCTFNPTSTLGCLKRLKELSLSYVHITEEGLGHLFSKSSSLEVLVMFTCSGIICLKIPSMMQHLKVLDVQRCKMLRAIEIDAPNVCSFNYYSDLPEFDVKNCSRLKHVELSSSCPSSVFSYARASFPSIARYIESLILDGCSKNANIPMLNSKLPYLKNLEIILNSVRGFAPSYDVFSLVSFIDASPALEFFILRVDEYAMANYPVVGDDDECPQRKLDFWHNCLKQVMITGFCSARSLVELTVQILESAQSLERLTLDTTYGYDRSIDDTIDKCLNTENVCQCLRMCKRAVEEAHRAVKTAAKYITGRVPLAVQFEVLEPCSRCHTGNNQ